MVPASPLPPVKANIPLLKIRLSEWIVISSLALTVIFPPCPAPYVELFREAPLVNVRLPTSIRMLPALAVSVGDVPIRPLSSVNVGVVMEIVPPFPFVLELEI